MLEFIVLGHIPGTHLQITFAWFAVGILAALVWADVRLHKNISGNHIDKKASSK